MKYYFSALVLLLALFVVATPTYAVECEAPAVACVANGVEFCSQGGVSGCHAQNGEVIQSAGTTQTEGQTSPSTQSVTCSPACASYQHCELIASLGEGRCVNNQNSDGSFQTSENPNRTSATNDGNGTFKNPLKAGSLTELLNAVLKGIVQLGSILLVLALVYVGFLFVAAQGAEEKIRDARNALLWTVIGGLILLGATAISEVITATVSNI
ncbi:MAG TPA: pilin [Candidatus Paceibacterota bacterium]|nr:pilin [Candidatus Paceibacterota bacterium]